LTWSASELVDIDWILLTRTTYRDYPLVQGLPVSHNGQAIRLVQVLLPPTIADSLNCNSINGERRGKKETHWALNQKAGTKKIGSEDADRENH
jgi:hypothetical protein